MTNKTDAAQAWQRWSIANCIPTPERGNDKKRTLLVFFVSFVDNT
jgi:hypothetical protein